MPSVRTRGNGHQLKHWTYPLHTRKHLFAVRVTKHSLPREAAESPSLDIFKSPLDTVLRAAGCSWPCFKRWLDQMISSNPFQPQPSCAILPFCENDTAALHLREWGWGTGGTHTHFTPKMVSDNHSVTKQLKKI